MSEDEMRRAAERFRKMARKIRENLPLKAIDLAILDELRRGAEPFKRWLELARYIGYHSMKKRDMR